MDKRTLDEALAVVRDRDNMLSRLAAACEELTGIANNKVIGTPGWPSTFDAVIIQAFKQRLDALLASNAFFQDLSSVHEALRLATEYDKVIKERDALREQVVALDKECLAQEEMKLMAGATIDSLRKQVAALLQAPNA